MVLRGQAMMAPSWTSSMKSKLSPMIGQLGDRKRGILVRRYIIGAIHNPLSLTIWQAGEISSLAILLLPQRTGHLMFPTIDIHPLPSPHNLHPADDRGDLTESFVSCETDYQHHSDSILVVSNLGSTTVSIDLSSTVSGAWLVESKNR